jgi:hypothetical protein
MSQASAVAARKTTNTLEFFAPSDLPRPAGFAYYRCCARSKYVSRSEYRARRPASTIQIPLEAISFPRRVALAALSRGRARMVPNSAAKIVSVAI